MYLIDFHTHFFPDAIAERTIKQLEDNCHIKAAGDGTLASLLDSMNKSGIELSVNAPIATGAEQVKGINRKMLEINNARSNVICLGTMHPEFSRAGDVSEEIGFLADNGFKGIKMHPEYQSFFPDDGKVKKIYRECADKKLFILFHSGADAAYEFSETHGMPKRMAKTADENPDLVIVLAHMGGYRMWDGVYRNLVGKDVFLDTSLTFELEDEALKNIIMEHGTDKILFGSDYPWGKPGDTAKRLEKLIEKEEDREKIFHKNAENLLGI